jgi:dGTPase
MTHSLEVAQLGRSIARSLQLNEDLVEAIALAHDLGHTPFGHAGQDALNDCMKGHGGFEHNLQSLRVVDVLEQRYPQFDGLNLTFETREGILKHCSRANAEKLEAQELTQGCDPASGGVARRFLAHTQPSLEAQLCNLADEIAYNAHDIDDGVRSGLITLEQLEAVPLFDQFRRETLAEFPDLVQNTQGRRLLYESIRRMLSAQVFDVIDATRTAINATATGIPDANAARRLGPLVQFGATMREGSALLKQFLMRNLYRHPQVMQTTDQARVVVNELFSHYLAAPGEMQADHAEQARKAGLSSQGESGVARVVADYIAGMTDRMAAREHERLSGRRLLV